MQSDGKKDHQPNSELTMRTREQIEKETNESGGKLPVGYMGEHRVEIDIPQLSIERATLEVLLDIRELLMNPPLEIVNNPITDQEKASIENIAVLDSLLKKES